MNALRSMALVLVLALLSGGVAEAKKGGKGKGRGDGKVKVEKFTTVDAIGSDVRVRSSARTSTRFPPGNAWGLRRNRGEPLPLGSSVRRGGFRQVPVDGSQIYRAGRVWEFDAADNRWELLP